MKYNSDKKMIFNKYVFSIIIKILKLFVIINLKKNKCQEIII